MAVEEYMEQVVIKTGGGVPDGDAVDDVELEIVDDTPEADRNREPMIEDPEPSEDELSTYSDRVKKRISTLQRAYHEERRAKESADRERTEALRYAQSVAENNRKLNERATANASLLHDSWRDKTESELTAAKNSFKEAYESGDSELIVEAQEKLNRATYRHEISLVPKEPPLHTQETVVQTPEDVYTAPPPNNDAQAWASKNVWFGKDKGMTGYVYGVHEDLITRGIRPNEDAAKYYGELDSAMRRTFPNHDWGDKPAREQRQTRTNIVAPVTRSSGGTRKVSLTQTQVAIAKRLNIPLAEYAKQVAILAGEK